MSATTPPTPTAAGTSFRLPDLGEGLTEAEIIRWLVAVGDEVAVNQPLVEVETAKAVVEVPSPTAGTIAALGAEEGGVLAVGAPLVTFATGQGHAEVPDAVAGGAPSVPAGGTGSTQREAVLVGYGPAAAAGPVRRRRRVAVPDQPAPAGRVLAKPPVRKLARDLGLDLAEVPGTGPGGTVTRADVDRFRQRTVTTRDPAPAPGQLPDAAQPAEAPAAAGTRVPVRGVRRATADAMTASAAVPQASVGLDVDVTRTMALVEELTARDAGAAEASAPSFLTLVARASLLALAERPMLSARWQDAAEPGGPAEIVVPASVSLGIAVAAPRGLLVPKVRDAGSLSLGELRRAIDGLVRRARAGELTPAELTDGSFTISNVGVFGVDRGSALVPPGETAILCVGAVRDRPWVVDGDLAVRKVVALTLSIDHRVVDGAEASAFLADLGALLADPGLMLARS
jgi:pyruvate dehydrogenase E2 component (dihydrolipoamide acetyltransferase)